jgi:hypothetical protein
MDVGLYIPVARGHRPAEGLHRVFVAVTSPTAVRESKRWLVKVRVHSAKDRTDYLVCVPRGSLRTHRIVRVLMTGSPTSHDIGENVPTMLR